MNIGFPKRRHQVFIKGQGIRLAQFIGVVWHWVSLRPSASASVRGRGISLVTLSWSRMLGLWLGWVGNAYLPVGEESTVGWCPGSCRGEFWWSSCLTWRWCFPQWKLGSLSQCKDLESPTFGLKWAFYHRLSAQACPTCLGCGFQKYSHNPEWSQKLVWTGILTLSTLPHKVPKPLMGRKEGFLIKFLKLTFLYTDK